MCDAGKLANQRLKKSAWEVAGKRIEHGKVRPEKLGRHVKLFPITDRTIVARGEVQGKW